MVSVVVKRIAHPIKGGKETKRQKVVDSDADALKIDLDGVPLQPPIRKRASQMKEGASKYTGVTFDKLKKKWKAKIVINGKTRFIGAYGNEEEAATDYARALFKYRGQGAVAKKISNIIDLSGVPPQPPISKSANDITKSSSKYLGVNFHANKWHARIFIDGKQRSIGSYENEEDAASNYARAVVKYKGQDKLDKLRAQAAMGQKISSGSQKIVIDLSDVPPQQRILKSKGRIKEGSSKYTGVSFDKLKKKWIVTIKIEGRQRYVGSYENEEEAASDYARAVFKYKDHESLNKAKEQTATEQISSESQTAIGLGDVLPQPPVPKAKKHIKRGALDRARGEKVDLSDVPSQQPILKPSFKRGGRVKEGASKYAGVTFYNNINKWGARIFIDGEQFNIGYYENEIEAATDYARAVFKYKKKRHE